MSHALIGPGPPLIWHAGRACGSRESESRSGVWHGRRSDDGNLPRLRGNESRGVNSTIYDLVCVSPIRSVSAHTLATTVDYSPTTAGWSRQPVGALALWVPGGLGAPDLGQWPARRTGPDPAFLRSDLDRSQRADA